MRLVIKFFNVERMWLPVTVRLDLLRKELHIIHIVLFLEFSLMNSDQILLLLLPVKLLTFKFTWVLDLLTLFLETLVRQVIDFLNIMHILLTLMLSMVVNLEWTLRSHEIWICLRMIICWNLLAIECQTNNCPYVILSAMHAFLNELVKSLVFAIKVVCGLIEPIHVFLAFRHITWWLIVSWWGLLRRFTNLAWLLSISTKLVSLILAVRVLIHSYSASLSLTQNCATSWSTLRFQLPLAAGLYTSKR